MTLDEVEVDFFFQAEDGIRDGTVTGVQTYALPICKFRQHQTRADGLIDHDGILWKEIADRLAHLFRRELLAARTSRADRRSQRRRGTLGAESRSEERRVGKECRSRWAAGCEKKKER